MIIKKKEKSNEISKNEVTFSNEKFKKRINKDFILIYDKLRCFYFDDRKIYFR